MTKREQNKRKEIKEIIKNLNIKKIDVNYDEFGVWGYFKNIPKEMLEKFIDNPIYEFSYFKQGDKLIIIFEFDFDYYEFILYLDNN
ncbi:MAG: hypothetical protein ACPL1F_07875 [bacterium]